MNKFGRLSSLFLLKRLVGLLFGSKKKFRLGIYGPPNVGKTSIANKISVDWLGKEVGVVSDVPHETREVQEVEHLRLKEGSKELDINLIDTPGISTKVDYEDFLKYKLKRKDAKKRAMEATKGIIEAIKWLDEMDAVLTVMDSTIDPYTQVNITILGNLEVRKIPVLVVANKTDLKNSKVQRIKNAFPQYKVVGVSAKNGDNFTELYEAIFKLSKKVK